MTDTPGTTRRFVAIGDSFTEGVGDRDPSLPNEVRGWADRVAEQLAKAQPGWEYANLAIRSKRMRQIVAEQLAPALELRPTLVTVYAGGNDVLDARTPMSSVLGDYELLIRGLAGTGAKLLLFTGYEVPLFPLVGLFRRRNRTYNDGVRRIAERYHATLVDYADFSGLDDRRMWASDRLHLSKRGHRRVAAEVLELLEVPHSVKVRPLADRRRRRLRRSARRQLKWLRRWVLPLVGRKIRRVTLGDSLEARWPSPVLVPPRGGLRKLEPAEVGYDPLTGGPRRAGADEEDPPPRRPTPGR